MALDAERIAQAILTRVTTNLAAQLDVVEALWAATDPLALPDIVTTHYGHKPTVLELNSAAFPFVAVVPARVTPVSTPNSYGWGDQVETYEVYLDYFVVAAVEETVNKLAARYGEALRLVLQAQRSIAGYDQRDYKPEVNLSEASRHGKTSDADFFDETDVDFIQGGRIIINCRGG